MNPCSRNEKSVFISRVNERLAGGLTNEIHDRLAHSSGQVGKYYRKSEQIKNEEVQ